MSDAETKLMQSILDKFGALLPQVCASSSVPPKFIAALIANESGGNPNAKRYEPAVCGHLTAVVLGKAPSYEPRGSRRAIGAQDINTFIGLDSGNSVSGADLSSTAVLGRLHDLASSFGLTQIMAWHLIEQDSLIALNDLSLSPTVQLNFTITLLAWFAEHYQLDLASDFAELFTCWNTGAPSAPTFDPNYVRNALMRMALYDALALADLSQPPVQTEPVN